MFVRDTLCRGAWGSREVLSGSEVRDEKEKKVSAWKWKGKAPSFVSG